jgi:hypothetical protein
VVGGSENVERTASWSIGCGRAEIRLLAEKFVGFWIISDVETETRGFQGYYGLYAPSYCYNINKQPHTSRNLLKQHGTTWRTKKATLLCVPQ